MPFITIKLLEGRTQEQKRKLMEGITHLCMETIDVPKEKVFIFFEDLKKDSYAPQGEFVSDREAKQQ